MKNILFLAPFLFLLAQKSFSQLSPSTTDEFCPKTNITFTKVFSGQYKDFSISSNFAEYTTGTISSYSYDQINNKTTVTFTLNFEDVNLNHKTSLSYKTNSGVNVGDGIMTFAKVKSLLYETGTPAISISTTSFPPCQITTVNVSFPKLKWKNRSTTPATEFGEISDYEYSVPAGWSVNGSVSGGANDIKLGTNVATITSDVTTAGEIKIRAANKCANGLTYGPWLIIPITRAKPQLSFVAPNPLCNSSTTYSAANVPSAFTNLLWQVTPSNLMALGSPNASSTLVTKQNNGTGNIQFTISAPGCPTSFTYSNLEITGSSQLITGEPTAITNIIEDELTTDCYVPRYRYTVEGAAGATNYKWYGRWPNGSFVLVQDGPDNYCTKLNAAKPGDCFDYEVKVVATNGCNTNNPRTYLLKTMHCKCSKGDGPDGKPKEGKRITKNDDSNETPLVLENSSLKIFPNPSTSSITISLPLRKDYTNAIKFVKIIDRLGKVKKEFQSNNQHSMNIPVANLSNGLYTIMIFDGTEWYSARFIKN